jgi:hypothetical protein
MQILNAAHPFVSIRISVEVSRGAARYRVSVKAESIRRALEIVERQNPSCAVKMIFPIEPEEFFIRDATVTAAPPD